MCVSARMPYKFPKLFHIALLRDPALVSEQEVVA